MRIFELLVCMLCCQCSHGSVRLFSDKVDGRLVERSRRVSLTFREVRSLLVGWLDSSFVSYLVSRFACKRGGESVSEFEIQQRGKSTYCNYWVF